jgi:hypothetical protein
MSLQLLESLLETLQFLTPRQRRNLLNSFTIKQMKVFEQACFNLVKNPVGISPTQIKKLKPHVNSVKIIAQPGHNLRSKKKVLTQKGGFLNILLPVLGTLVSSFLAK